MAKYKAYPEYKDSGVEWLGEVPSHWNVAKTMRYFKIAMGQTILKEQLEDDGEWPVYSATEGDSYFGYVSSPQVKLGVGDLVIPARGNSIGSVKLVSGKSTTTQTTIYCKHLTRAIYPAFAYYFMLGNRNNLFWFTQTAIPQITVEEVGCNPILLPTYEEQGVVASFLDHETAKIDNLIEKQQQLIELLKEKRQAVISHAVTKGLNPDVTMKDSGVEWLGEVPEHWELVPLKYLCNFSGGGTPTKDNLSYWQGGTVPWVSPKDMKSFWISETQDYVTPKAVSESSTNYVEEGSLLMVVRSGILQRNIPVAINIVKVTMNQDMKALRFNERMKAHYAAYFINGNVNSLLLEWTKEGATVESIEHEYLANGLIPVPPIDEQHSIIKSISDQMIRFELLEEKALTGIRLLQERRTALISAAVTGKIDVRDWVAPDAQDVEASQEATA